MPGIFRQPPQPQLPIHLVPIAEAAAGDNPPFGLPRTDTPGIKAWWAVASIQPRQPAKINQVDAAAVPENNPPFGLPRADTIALTAWWKAPDRTQQPGIISPAIPGQSIDNPPIVGTDTPIQLVWWIPPPPAPQRAKPMSPGIPGQSIDTPPTTGAQPHIDWRWWLPAPPQPQTLTLLVPITPAAPADDPPFGVPRYDGIIAGIWLAQAAIPRPWFPLPMVVQDGSIGTDNPPFGVPRVDTIALAIAWQVPVRPQQPGLLSPAIPGQSIDNPPVKGAQTPLQLIAWIPAPPRPQQPGLLSPGIPGQSIDNPPTIGAQPHIDWLWWLPAPPRPQTLVSLVPPPDVVAGDNPPFGVPRYDGIIVGIWLAQATIPRPRQLPPLVVQGGTWVAAVTGLTHRLPLMGVGR